MKKRFEDKNLKTHVEIHFTTVVIGAVLIVIGCQLGEFGSLSPLAWLGILTVALGILWRVLFVKCPHCGSRLYSARGIPEYCPDCGGKLL